MATKRNTKKAVAPTHDISTESGLIAHEILQQYGDLAPSVNKIMAAGLTEQGQLHAIDAFRGALSTPADPMRDPSNAIAAGRLVDGSG